MQLEQDEHFCALFALYDLQRAVMRWRNLLSPLPALQDLSMALTGTDMPHQIAFQRQAEAHRRSMVSELNSDMSEHGAGADYDYQADEDLWERIEDFRYQPPSLIGVLASVWPDALLLLAWLAGVLVLAAANGRSFIAAQSEARAAAITAKAEANEQFATRLANAGLPSKDAILSPYRMQQAPLPSLVDVSAARAVLDPFSTTLSMRARRHGVPAQQP